MGQASQGAQATMCAEPGGSPHTFDGSSEAIEFRHERVRKHGRLVIPHDIRGTRSRPKERVRTGAYKVIGPFSVNPSPLFLANWLPRILGAAAVGNTFSLAETLPAFGLLINRVNETFEYTDCYVNRALFRGRASRDPEREAPQPVELVIEVVGKTEVTGTADPGLTLGVAAADAPYIFEDADSGLTLQSAARDFMAFELLIDNFLDPRFTNSLTATSITPQDRLIHLKTTHPYTSDESALYAQSLAGAAGSLVFTNGSYSCTFTFGVVQVPPVSPFVAGKREIVLDLDNSIHRSGGTDELVVTNVSS